MYENVSILQGSHEEKQFIRNYNWNSVKASGNVELSWTNHPI